MRELRHTCICLCSTCERLGCGAFGKQPDGAEPLQIEIADADVIPAQGCNPVSVTPLILMAEAPKLGTVHP